MNKTDLLVAKLFRELNRADDTEYVIEDGIYKGTINLESLSASELVELYKASFIDEYVLHTSSKGKSSSFLLTNSDEQEKFAKCKLGSVYVQAITTQKNFLFTETSEDFVRRTLTKSYLRYFITNDNISSSDDKKPVWLTHLNQARSLYTHFRSIADHEEGSNLIFFLKRKTNLPIKAMKDDLCELPNLDAFIVGFSNDDPQLNLKKDMLKLALGEFLKNVDPEKRFSTLLNGFNDFTRIFDENLQIFLSELDYEKIRDEIRHRNFEYTCKINGVLSGLQNKLLAIPISVLLLATQMKPGIKNGFVNMMVTVAIWMFFTMFFFLISNEMRTLESIGAEIDHLEGNAKRAYQEIPSDLEKTFKHVKQRKLRQRDKLLCLDLISGGFFIGSLWLFTHYGGVMWVYKCLINPDLQLLCP